MSHHFDQVPSPAVLSELLPEYDIEKFITKDGKSAVYKARQISLDRDVAIKILLSEVSQGTDSQDAFLSEAQLMAKLNHLNLLGVFDFGTIGDMSYIVMEYVEGVSLHQATWNQMVDPVQAATIVKGICDGLSHAHMNGIVHRDIKPANILLTPDAEPKIADFSLAHSADADKPGLIMRTPGYTAPEVFSDPALAGELADIYSVGVILHQLLTGLDPTGSRTPLKPPSVSTDNLHLDAIWRKATHINPVQRYPSIAAMSQDLDQWLETKDNPLATGGPALTSVTSQTFTPLPSSNDSSIIPIVVAIIVLVGLLSFAGIIIKDQFDESRKGDGHPLVEDNTPTTEDPTAPPEIVSSPSAEVVAPSKPAPLDGNANKKPVIVDKNLPKTTPKPEPKSVPEPARVGTPSTGTFAGKWEVSSDGKVERWIAHPDGLVEVVGRGWTAKWVMLDNGTLEVRWDGKKPHVMKREGNHWVGKGGFGQATTFKPSNW